MRLAVDILEHGARFYGDHIALEDEAGTLTYDELLHMSKAIASALFAGGFSSDNPVAVFLPKSSACVVSFYGALFFGAPYAPLDYNSPDARLSCILDNLKPGCIITDDEGCKRLSALNFPESLLVHYDTGILTSVDDSAIELALDNVIDLDPAYIMYTSGSTGIPKGVMISHRAVVDYANWVISALPVTDKTIFGQQSGFHFDNSVFHMYVSALSGAKLIIIPDALLRYPYKLTEYMAQKEISYIFWAPSVLISIANSGALETTALPALTTVSFGGEVMPTKQLNIWRKALPHCTYINMYGPTEITDVCCFYIVDREFSDIETIPIGRACKNMRVLILKEDGGMAGVNETGELCVIGSGVALGYWNAPEITDSAFVWNPQNQYFMERMYRTGDFAYFDEAGLIHFCGRRDDQIKLRGNRIELGDIEAAARNIAQVEDACALFDKERESITLFLQTKQQFSLRKFNLELRKHIPGYMLPGELVCMEQFPLNANRKVDKLQLRQI